MDPFDKSLKGFRRMGPLLILGSVLASCATLPTPVQEDIDHAPKKWGHIQLSDLQWGRKLYVTHCSGCHYLHLPKELSQEEWMDAMDKMENRAEVDDATRSSILKYLTTYARDESSK